MPSGVLTCHETHVTIHVLRSIDCLAVATNYYHLFKLFESMSVLASGGFAGHRNVAVTLADNVFD